MHDPAPLRHMDTGTPCPAINPNACERAWPEIHHRPRHCREVVARDGTSRGVGRHGKAPSRFVYEDTSLRPVTR